MRCVILFLLNMILPYYIVGIGKLFSAYIKENNMKVTTAMTSRETAATCLNWIEAATCLNWVEKDNAAQSVQRPTVSLSLKSLVSQ